MMSNLKPLSRQEHAILNRLLDGERISQPQAAQEQCWRLGARIHNIRKHGWYVQATILPGRFKLYYIDADCPRFIDCDEQLALPLEGGVN